MTQRPFFAVVVAVFDVAAVVLLLFLLLFSLYPLILLSAFFFLPAIFVAAFSDVVTVATAADLLSVLFYFGIIPTPHHSFTFFQLRHTHCGIKFRNFIISIIFWISFESNGLIIICIIFQQRQRQRRRSDCNTKCSIPKLISQSIYFQS